MSADPFPWKFVSGSTSAHTHKDDRILGFTLIGAEAGDVMAAVHTAMLAGLSYTALADAAFAHPTMAEGLSSLFSHVPPRAVRQAA
jgi:pyruvate/2-oxoglutarate dehydrogenase complex dihydrolipoamide dehydrogenase (E3) component